MGFPNITDEMSRVQGKNNPSWQEPRKQKKSRKLEKDKQLIVAPK